MGVFIIGSLTVALLITLPLTATALTEFEDPSDHQQSDIPGYSPVDDENNYKSIYKSALMLQPHRSGLNGNQSNKETGVKVEVTLKSFTDQGLRLPGGMTCACPRDHQCSYLGTTEARCFMSLTVIISSPWESVRTFSTEFAPLSASGKLDFPKMTQEQASKWNHPQIFQLNSKPSAIDIFVHHKGVVINAENGELTQMQTVVHVDTFLLPIFNVMPSIGGGYLDDHSQSSDGQMLQTQLEWSYGVQCTGSAVGPDCDLHCNRSSVSSNIAICESVRTGFLYTCSYTSGTQQVHDCKPCPWGIAEDSYCRDNNGGPLHPSSASVVPLGYKTATITLAVLAGALFVLLGLVTIFALMKQKKRNEEAPGHNYHSSLRAEGRANSPLLQATYTAQSPVPTPAPRCEPNLGAIPAKSALRQTNYIPPAHLGGHASVNDTLNSSFASVPMPPSVEADV